jgi:hypothetical protein
MPVTLAEVVTHADVWGATACRVVNGRRHVPTRSRESTEFIARDLDFVPDHSTRELSHDEDRDRRAAGPSHGPRPGGTASTTGRLHGAWRSRRLVVP